MSARFDKSSKLWFVNQDNFSRRAVEKLNIPLRYIGADDDDDEDDV